MSNWVNSDGLLVKLGAVEATAQKGGATNISGDKREIVFDITMTELTSASAIVQDNLIIPKSARIEEIEIEVLTACTGATAVLNLGTVRSDRTTTYDENGLVDAATVASLDTAGKRLNIIYGSDYDGAQIGTTLAYNGLIVADYDTAAFTAGLIRVRVKYFFI